MWGYGESQVWGWGEVVLGGMYDGGAGVGHVSGSALVW